MARVRESVTIPRKEYERLKKAERELARARDEAEALGKILQAEKDYREGRYVSASSLEEAIEKSRAQSTENP